MHSPSPPLPSSAWPRLAGGGVRSPVWCSFFCITLLFFCFQVMTAAAAPIATNVTALASSLPPLAVGSRASPPSWVERMQADDTSPNKRSVAMWGANHPTKHLITKTQWTLVVTDNGTVMGVRSREDKPKFGALEFITLTVITLTTHMPHLLLTPQPNRPNQPSQYGRIAIRGKKAGRFICMNFTGEVYSSPTYTDDCEFQEQPVGNTLYAYYSLKYSGHKKQRKRKWYLGINKRGKMRLGFRTKYNRPFAQFITTSNVTQFPTPPFPAPPQPTPRLTTTSPRVTSPTTTKKSGRRRPHRVPCVSSGPFSRCSNNGGGGRRKKDGKNKRKNKKRKRKSRRLRRKHWRRRPRPLHRSDRSKVPLLS